MCLTSNDEFEEVNEEEECNVTGATSTVADGEIQISSDTSILNCGEYNYSGADYAETFASAVNSSADSSILMSETLELNSGASTMILSPDGITMTCAEVMLG